MRLVAMVTMTPTVVALILFYIHVVHGSMNSDPYIQLKMNLFLNREFYEQLLLDTNIHVTKLLVKYCNLWIN